jgi:hypothetical protein
LENAALDPSRKLAAIAVATRETGSNGEAVIGQLLREDTARKLDASLFSNVAGDATRPLGILAGVSPLTAATGGGNVAMKTDLGAARVLIRLLQLI